ncbi:winged helix-turn-helix domain-containing protein [Streptomyces laurentii]|uniref:helix-turn-helix domain-containing protein n=1 Tax=Streptomyces laurentii TaxID=39478 RepID=UPI0036C47A6B
MAHGWADQRWTLARIKTLIGRLFYVSYTVEGTWLLMKRHGWSWQPGSLRSDLVSGFVRPVRGR